jgi:hypothetical protein
MDLTDECAVKIRFSLFSRPERWTMATGSCFGNNYAWVFFYSEGIYGCKVYKINLIEKLEKTF